MVKVYVELGTPATVGHLATNRKASFLSPLNRSRDACWTDDNHMFEQALVFWFGLGRVILKTSSRVSSRQCNLFFVLRLDNL